MSNLDDINQTTLYIPFSDTDDGEAEHREKSLPLRPSTSMTSLSGKEPWLKAYRDAWGKCLHRMQSIIRTLHEPVVGQVLQRVRTAYTDALPGLPYPELPVICVTNPTSGSAFINDIASQLDTADFDDNTSSLAIHIYPTDCTNLTMAMKMLVTGFVERPNILGKVKRKATALANHDIQLLAAWHTAVIEEHGAHPTLVVIMHDFEQFDPAVIQDLFYISSLHIPQLPLVFILSLSSPSSPSYLHIAYPRSTLALLRVQKCVVPSGIKLLEEIVFKTFFDLEFEPDLMVGPVVLTFLSDYFIRQNPSLESCITILHLAHLRHFSVEPLALLLQSTPSPRDLSHASTFDFLDTLLVRLHSPDDSPENWSKPVASLLLSVDDARAAFYIRARRLRIGLGMVRLLQGFMKSQGYKGLEWNAQPGVFSILDVAVDAMREKLGSGVNFLGTMVKKLRTNQLNILLEELHDYFHSMPHAARSDEEEARTKVVFFRSALPEQMDDGVSATGSQLAGNVGEWMMNYISNLLKPLESSVLWDIWYTGLAPFPADLINPSIRASILAGLLRPHDFIESDGIEKQQSTPSLWELPDTSILFRRYLDSGKMINIYDWFESFQLELETQRKHFKKEQHPEGNQANKVSPKRSAAKVSQPPPAGEEEDEERWKIEVQARFIRALHELDYLGFIKHTGRKVDHVQRTVYDIYD